MFSFLCIVVGERFLMVRVLLLFHFIRCFLFFDDRLFMRMKIEIEIELPSDNEKVK